MGGGKERQGCNPGLQRGGEERRGCNSARQDCVGHPCTGGGKEEHQGRNPGLRLKTGWQMPNNEPHKPHRLRRLETVWTSRDRPLFFVTFCTAERHRWLNSAEIHQSFLKFCIQSPKRASVWIGKYVLMPDHIHVFVSAEGSQGLSRWVGSIKRHLAKVRRQGCNSVRQDCVGHPYMGGGKECQGCNPGLQGGGKERQGCNPGLQGGGKECPGYNPGLQPEGKAWQSGFFDHALRGRESYSEKWDYVRLNPVRAGLVSKPEEWKLKSCDGRGSWIYVGHPCTGGGKERQGCNPGLQRGGEERRGCNSARQYCVGHPYTGGGKEKRRAPGIQPWPTKRRKRKGKSAGGTTPANKVAGKKRKERQGFNPGLQLLHHGQRALMR